MAGLDPAIWVKKIVEKFYFVYILASKPHGTLYIGVTSDLPRRLYQHRDMRYGVFTKRYNVFRLVHFEQFSEVHLALQREANLKHWSRRWKVELIEKNNPEWKDLFDLGA